MKKDSIVTRLYGATLSITFLADPRSAGPPRPDSSPHDENRGGVVSPGGRHDHVEDCTEATTSILRIRAVVWVLARRVQKEHDNPYSCGMLPSFEIV